VLGKILDQRVAEDVLRDADGNVVHDMVEGDEIAGFRSRWP
jgi:hypothetical protein